MLSRQGTSKISGKKYATALPSFPKERLRHTFDKLLIPSIVTDFIVQFQWGILKSAKKSQKKPKFFLLELFPTKKIPHFPIGQLFFTFFTVAGRRFPPPHDFQNCDGWNILGISGWRKRGSTAIHPFFTVTMIRGVVRFGNLVRLGEVIDLRMVRTIGKSVKFGSSAGGTNEKEKRRFVAQTYSILSPRGIRL